MSSWLKIGIVLTVLAVALPAPSPAADEKPGEHPKAGEHAKGGHDKAGHGVDHHSLDRLSKAWGQMPEDDRKRALEELTRNMTPQDRHATEEFFARLAADYAEKHKRAGVEAGLFKGAIEVSLWTILVFLLLMVVLRKFAWGPIMEGLNKREQGIARDKHEAELARKEAADLRTRLDAELARVNQEISAMVAKARQDAEKTNAETLARGKADLHAERERLYRDLAISRDNALKDIWTQVTQVATLISAKAITKSLTEADHRGLIDEALNEFRGAATVRKGEVEEARA